MKKHIMIFLVAFCILFSINNTQSFAANSIETPDVSSIIENALTKPVKLTRNSNDSQAETLKTPVVLTKVSYSSKRVNLQWKKFNHDNIYKYMIIRIPFKDALDISEDEIPQSASIIEIDPAKTSYTDSVSAGEVYIYSITALIGDDEHSITHTSNPDSESCIAIIATVQKPTVTVSNLYNGIQVSWDKVTGADGFYVYRKIYGKSYNYDAPYYHTTKGTATSYTNTKYTNGTRYCYQVAPYVEIKIDGKVYYFLGKNSASKHIKRLARPAVTVSNTDTSIKLSWKKITGATSYEIYRNGKYVTTTTKLYWNDTKRTNGTKYTYNVRVYNKTSSYKSYSAKSVTDTMYRLSRTNIKNLTGGTKTLKVTYTQNSKATGYKIQYSRKKDFTNSLTETVKGYKNSTTKIKINYGNSTYYVRVRPYKVVDGKTYYGEWCAAKSIYVKK